MIIFLLVYFHHSGDIDIITLFSLCRLTDDYSPYFLQRHCWRSFSLSFIIIDIIDVFDYYARRLLFCPIIDEWFCHYYYYLPLFSPPYCHYLFSFSWYYYFSRDIFFASRHVSALPPAHGAVKRRRVRRSATRRAAQTCLPSRRNKMLFYASPSSSFLSFT